MPGDAEFLTLEKEIRDGATLPEMLFHYIRPEHDEDLQSNRMDLKEVMKKHQALLRAQGSGRLRGGLRGIRI